MAVAVPIPESGADSAENSQRRPVEVADSIEMRIVATDRWYYDGYSLRRPVAEFSPDGTKFVILVRRGNLQKNTNAFSLLLWHVDKIPQRSVPDELLTMESSSNREAIKEVQWLADNVTVAFLGERVGEHQQLYTFNAHTRVLNQRTHHQSSLLAYSITPDGKSIAYVAEGADESIWNKRAVKEGLVVSNEPLNIWLSRCRLARFLSPGGNIRIQK